MTISGFATLIVFLLVLTALTKPMGSDMARVYAREATWLDPVLRPLERAIYRLARIDETHEMRWTEYAVSLLAFSAVSVLTLYALQRLQAFLPFNPQRFGPVPPDLAWNTAVSFVTNTNWQAYAGEVTLSHGVQMLGLTVQNFVSAAVGMAVAIAFIRGLARRESATIGNFWVDLVRGTLWILLPLSFLFALVLVSQGVVQNLRAADVAQLLEPQRVRDAQGAVHLVTTQRLPQGPVASQVAIKLLGTNGGGFFGANASHPFENPTPLSNFLQMLAILLIPAGFTYTLGRMTGARRHGWALFVAMSLLFVAGAVASYAAEAQGNPLAAALGVDPHPSLGHPGSNMEGKELRFGLAGAAFFAAVTTAAACGAVNAMHDALTPLGGLVPLVNMQLGEVIFGGVGAGLYGMLVMVILAVFLAGLMVGRTPEYLGKKIDAYDVKMAMLYTILFPWVVLALTAIAVRSPWGLRSLGNPGPHGLTEILYAFTSATANNGSAFAGLNANTWGYNLTLGMAMWLGRFFMIVPVLAIAGNLARKRSVPPSPGTLPVTTPSFVVLLIGVILLVGALTFFPALSLGPILEPLLLRGRVF